MGRRVGRWTYDSRIGWRLDGSDLVIDSEPAGCALRPRVWTVKSGPKAGQEIDRYMDAAMAFVEENEAEYRPKRPQCRHLAYLAGVAS